MFRLIIRGCNCAKYVDKCLGSLQEQTVTDWLALVIVDPSTDSTEDMAVKWANNDSRVSVRLNTERHGVCRNTWDGISGIGSIDPAVSPDDIVCILDLDDYLYRPTSLAIVKAYYDNHPRIMATYGSFRLKNGVKSHLCRKYNHDEKPRKTRWRASHLKTFKYGVIKHIPQDYFMHKGEWGQGASDLALMFCVMEIVGMDRVKRIKESVYFYRNDIPNSLKRKIQIKWARRWRAKKPLKKQF